MPSDRQKVLCLSGHDPTGGAGIQADIEAVGALGGHAVTAITAHTAQDTRNVSKVESPSPAFLGSQLRVLLADVEVSAVKVGLLGDAGLVPVIARAITKLRVPVVVDPVLRAGGGRNLANSLLIEAIRTTLLPLSDVLTPNHDELQRLAHQRGSDERAARELLELGAKSVLLTGGDEAGDTVVNSWYRQGRSVRRFSWPRVPGTHHGAGCTLAAAVATLLAQGYPPEAAVEDAQAFTDQALRNSIQVGRGRRVPGRVRK